jgi:excisionase family DNA binding protein
VVEPLCLSVKDAASYIGLSKSRLYELIGDKTIEARKLGARTVVPVAALRAYVENSPLMVAA